MPGATMMDESAAEFLESVIAYETFINQKYDNDTSYFESHPKQPNPATGP